jgi:O-antigen/teichoic acid export membrane protein
LLGAIAVGIGVPAFVKLVGVFDLFQFRLPGIKPDFAFYRPALLRILLVDGVLMLFLTLSFAGIFQIDKMFLGVLIGAAAVTIFSVMAKIFLLALGVYALTFRSLWPAYTEAVHRGDFGWVKRWLVISTSAGLLIIFAVGMILDLVGKPIYRMWLKGTDFAPPPGLALSFTACFAMWVWVTSHAALLNATRILRPQITILAAHAILTVAIMPFLVLRWQVNGAAWAPFLAGLATSGWGYPWLVRKHVFCAK